MTTLATETAGSTLALLEVEYDALETDSQVRLAAVRLQGADNGKRNEMDFYPTPASCTVALLDYLQISSSTPVWEPAAGDGAISRVLEQRGHEVISTDLRYGTYGVGGINFLAATASPAPVIITNPPFCEAEAFIRKCQVLKVQQFAMLLKAQYFHAAERLPLFRLLPPSLILALTWRPCFRPELKAGGTMDFSWFVWDVERQGTTYDVLTRPVVWSQGELFAEETT